VIQNYKEKLEGHVARTWEKKNACMVWWKTWREKNSWKIHVSVGEEK